MRKTKGHASTGRSFLGCWMNRIPMMVAVVALVITVAAIPATAGQPRVLLIGDSIANGYANTVVTELKGVAEVVKNPGNAAATSNALASPAAAENGEGQFVTTLDSYLALGPFDVIHFNWGLHDLKGGGIPTEQYVANLEKLVDRMQKSGAKLIFATTTPVPPVNRENRQPSKVVEFNEAAVALMKQKGVMIDDLYAAILPRQEELQMKDNVHFGGAGYQLLGQQVAATIRACLEGKQIEPPPAPTATVAPKAEAPVVAKKDEPVAPKSEVPVVPPKVEVPAETPPAGPPSATPAVVPPSSAPKTPVAPTPSAGNNEDAAREVAKLVKVTVAPAFPFEWDVMRVGTLQHHDCRYRSTLVPEELIGGYQFRGIHRVPSGTVITMEFLAPTTVWFSMFNHPKYDGGYAGILSKLDGWKRCAESIEYGEGIRMVLYRLDSNEGKVVLPASTVDRGCIGMVFKAME